MQICSKTSKSLSRFRLLSEEVLITPASRFFIFGEGNEGEHRGMVVEGRIKERPDHHGLFQIPKKGDKSLIEVEDPRFDPEKKIKFFDDLMRDTRQLVEFVIDADSVKTLKKTHRSKARTHIRFYRKPGQDAFARSFNARKYFAELIDEDTEDFDQLGLSEVTGEDFYTYVKLSTFCRLVNDSYSVSVFDNRLMLFTGMECDLTFYIRDQALGDEFEQQLEDPNLTDSVLLFDPRRARVIRRSMQRQ
jgi:hypothetical protein